MSLATSLGERWLDVDAPRSCFPRAGPPGNSPDRDLHLMLLPEPLRNVQSAEGATE